MSELRFRILVAIVCLTAHVLSIGSVIIGSAKGKFDFSTELPALISSLSPLFAVYTTTLVKYAVRTRHKIDEGQRLSLLFVLVTFLLQLILSFGALGAIWAAICGLPGISKFQNLIIVIGVIETAFAGQFAHLFSALFPLERRTQPARRRSVKRHAVDEQPGTLD
jgi:hypothetical protein